MARANNPPSPIRRMPAWEDRALVTAIARRQQDALDRLYERYHAMVYHLALRILQRRESAEEVVYAVFWQVWSEASRYDARRDSVMSWLSTLARSRAIDALRAQRGSPTVEESIPAQSLPADPVDDQEEITSLGQRVLLVRNALQALPPDQRVPLELSFFAGLTHIEIAEQLAEPVETMKTRIHSAMLRLREQVRPLLGREL